MVNSWVAHTVVPLHPHTLTNTDHAVVGRRDHLWHPPRTVHLSVRIESTAGSVLLLIAV